MEESLFNILNTVSFDQVPAIILIKYIKTCWGESLIKIKRVRDLMNIKIIATNNFIYDKKKYDDQSYEKKIILIHLHNKKSEYLSVKSLKIFSYPELSDDPSIILPTQLLAEYVMMPCFYYMMVNLIYKYPNVDIKLIDIASIKNVIIKNRIKIQQSISKNEEATSYPIPILHKKNEYMCYICDPYLSLSIGNDAYIILNYEDLETITNSNDNNNILLYNRSQSLISCFIDFIS